MDLGLHAKVALVVASTAGLGLATAEALLAEGASVFICGRDEQRLDATLQRLQQQFGERVAGDVADVARTGAVGRLVGYTVKQFGKLDILVTNAGGPPAGNFDSVSFDDWERGLDLTLMSAVRLIKTALPYLRQSDAASILTITSVSAKQPIANLLLSNAIRPAVIGLTKSLAIELGPQNVRINSILPGWTRTDRVDYLLQSRAEQNGTTIAQEETKISGSIPLRRMGTVAEFGRVAAFLCSPAAGYVTGESVLVDGGSYGGLM